jgi:hypothetical protein
MGDPCHDHAEIKMRLGIFGQQAHRLLSDFDRLGIFRTAQMGEAQSPMGTASARIVANGLSREAMASSNSS